MPVTLIKSHWEDGELVFTSGATEVFRITTTGIKVAGVDVDGTTLAIADADADNVATVANLNTVGGIPIVYRITATSGADGNHDVVVAVKSRVILAWLVLKGAGTAGSTVTIKNGTTNAITDAIDVSAGGDKAVFLEGDIDDAFQEIAAAGTLRVSKASTGGDFPGAEVYVLALKVA